MQIACWSNIRGKSATTSNLAVISTIFAMEYKERNILIENHINMNSLENAFSGWKKHLFVKETNLYYQYTGLDYLIKQLHSDIQSEIIVQDVLKEILSETLYYIPQTFVHNKEVFEYELNSIITALLNLLQKSADNIWIDTAEYNNLSTKIILDQSDLVIVNLCQDPYCITDFFQNYISLCKKAIFFIGNYNGKSKYNLKNILRQYQIPKNKIGVIPYHIELRDALLSGNLLSFLSRNYECKRKDSNYKLIRELKKTTAIVKENIELLNKEEHFAQVVS